MRRRILLGKLVTGWLTSLLAGCLPGYLVKEADPLAPSGAAQPTLLAQAPLPPDFPRDPPPSPYRTPTREATQRSVVVKPEAGTPPLVVIPAPPGVPVSAESQALPMPATPPIADPL